LRTAQLKIKLELKRNVFYESERWAIVPQHYGAITHYTITFPAL